MFKLIPNFFKTSTPVRTSQQALLIWERIAHKKFPNIDYSRYRVSVDDGDNKPFIYGGMWCVYYSPINENGEIEEVLGGGGPEILIRKKDGKIVHACLQRW